MIVLAALPAVVVLIPVIAILGIVTKSMLNPLAPPLLAQATAGSGWFGGCPPLNEQEAVERARSGEALSPELNQKLATQFPPGSGTDSLVQTLTEQSFKLAETCQNDFTIRRAYFQGLTRGSLFETRAEIYWKTKGDNLVWTKGFVMFVGL